MPRRDGRRRSARLYPLGHKGGIDLEVDIALIDGEALVLDVEGELSSRRCQDAHAINARHHVLALNGCSSEIRIYADKALPWVKQLAGLTLAESWTAAVRLALTAKALVITGGPGVGKTTIVSTRSYASWRPKGSGSSCVPPQAVPRAHELGALP